MTLKLTIISFLFSAKFKTSGMTRNQSFVSFLYWITIHFSTCDIFMHAINSIV